MQTCSGTPSSDVVGKRAGPPFAGQWNAEIVDEPGPVRPLIGVLHEATSRDDAELSTVPSAG